MGRDKKDNKRIKNSVHENWVLATDELPKPLETVWITNGKGWTNLGCLVEIREYTDHWKSYYHWAESNGVIYEEDGLIVAECESEDLDVIAWHPLPKAYKAKVL